MKNTHHAFINPSMFASMMAIAACLFLSACNSGSDSADPLDENPPPTGQTGDGTLETVLEHVLAETGVPAVTAMFIHDGMVAEQAAVGIRSTASPEPVTEFDQWHLGSLTKSMTSTLTAVLVEQGILSWNTTIEDVFPDLIPTMNTAYQDVRMDELLSHTAGITTTSSRIAVQVISTESGVMRQRYRFSELALAIPPENDKGVYAYSNAGYVIAGAMLERLTGASWESLMQHYVFDALAMSDSGFGAPGANGSDDQPYGHVPGNNGWISIAPDADEADSPPLYGPAGTVHASLADIQNYLLAHLHGAQGNDVPGFLGHESFSKLHQPLPNSSYALGWDVAPGGFTHIGSNDLWLAQMVVVPEADIAVFIAINAADADSPDGGTPMATLLKTGDILQTRFEAASAAQ